MFLTTWPKAISPKHLHDAGVGEIFRYGDNQLGTTFGQGRASSVPWTHLLDLSTFRVTQFNSLLPDMPLTVFSLGDEWHLRAGGEAAECTFDKPPMPGSLLSDGSGLGLVAKGLNSLACFGLKGSHAGRHYQLPLNSRPAVFDTWSLLARESATSTFEVSRFDFDFAHRSRAGAVV